MFSENEIENSMVAFTPNNVNGKNEKAINEQQKNKLKNISISTKSAKSQWNYSDSSFYYC